nr:MAG TPA: hypothetical protein [Caudoviricetes sp.]
MGKPYQTNLMLFRRALSESLKCVMMAKVFR